MEQETYKIMEYDRVREMLAGCASSLIGKERAQTMLPTSDFDEAVEWIQQTTEAVTVLATAAPPFGGIFDIRPHLKKVKMGAVLDLDEITSIMSTLYAMRNIKHFFRDSEVEAPTLRSWARSIEILGQLERLLDNTVDEHGAMREDASVELRRIRRELHAAQAHIKERISSILHNAEYQKFFQDAIVTVRDERYVIPVKQEYRSRFPGIVHDQSATGATLFIEPMAVVELNNDVKQLTLAEQQEIQRILRHLSAEINKNGGTLAENCRILGDLDFAFAKARLAQMMEANRPELNREGRTDLREARHPFIAKDKVVPIDIRIGEDYRMLLITGPNTGGKTVSMKTLGMMVLLAQSGCYLPTAPDPVIAVYPNIYADIGDEQSIEQSLSTFSAHMTHIVRILKRVEEDDLVLLDELGAGTDPEEGAALAMAILEKLLQLRATTVATTHYSELKTFAYSREGIENACVEFDVKTLRPTYRLLIGIPGKSNAFAICRKLGLSEDILKEANDLVGKSDKDFEDVISQLEQQRQQMESARREAERLKQETAKIKQQSEEYNLQLQKEKDKAMEAARREAQGIIEEARAAANAASEELKALRKQLESSADTTGINQRQAELRRVLNETEDKIRAQAPQKERPKASRGILVGDTVELLKLGTKASVLAINKDGTYQLQAGILKMTAKADEIYLLENENPYAQKGGHPKHSGREMKMTAMPTEIDLRGMDCVEAICVLDRYLDEAMRAKLTSVRIIHGKGTGALRAAVQQDLKKNKFIKKFRLGQYGEGEDGVTIAEFA